MLHNKVRKYESAIFKLSSHKKILIYEMYSPDSMNLMKIYLKSILKTFLNSK